MPSRYQDLFVAAFAKLHYRMLWKFETGRKDISKNVIIQKWMPKQDILCEYTKQLFTSWNHLHLFLPIWNSNLMMNNSYVSFQLIRMWSCSCHTSASWAKKPGTTELLCLDCLCLPISQEMLWFFSTRGLLVWWNDNNWRNNCSWVK